uniref:ATP synthase complex subunit 8 n=1 Tax=Sagittarius serpentarius TaxID=56258 RepID=W8EDW0_SAGSE|nr:ATP synthase subunit 8 [Sagittarius serpentarius]AHJ91129.1 ATP synthase subunit 8 [Sagittarius serpentarius]QOD97883.1 ATP synthase F0 subunit 8 [Sagittarius serpentarius]
MPQLNPGPWFFIMLISWLTLSFILQPKILTHISTNTPTNKPNKPLTTHPTPWNWPWT